MSRDSRIAFTGDGLSLSQLIPVLGTMKSERLEGMVKALEISLDRQQWFAILEASEGRPVA